MSKWQELDAESLTEWINLKLSCTPEFEGFQLNDVLESLILQSVSEYVLSRNTEALIKISDLIRRLDSSGILDRSDLEPELVYPLVSPAVSLALHDGGLVELRFQLDAGWKDAETRVKRFLAELVEEVAEGRSTGAKMTELLVLVAFSKEEAEIRKKRANILLEKMLGKVLGKSG